MQGRRGFQIDETRVAGRASHGARSLAYTLHNRVETMRDPLLCHKDLRRERHRGLSVYLAPGAELSEVLESLESPGEPLKEGAKGSVRRVGRWVVKESGLGPLSTIKRTARRARYRQGWLAAHHLRGVSISYASPKVLFR